jgi:hypothetical protein
MWGEGEKCAVLLCFDFDAESLWIAKNLTTPSVMSRGEYGDRVGVPRILSLLERYSVKATFFVPAETVRSHPDTVKRIYQKKHEIAHHVSTRKTSKVKETRNRMPDFIALSLKSKCELCKDALSSPMPSLNIAPGNFLI